MPEPVSPIHIACAADRAFVPHCAAMLHSLLTQHPDAQVHFLCDKEFDTGTLTKLETMVTATGGGWHAHHIPTDWIAELPRLRAIPALMWYRVFLPQLLPAQSRVLYLDADTLVVDKLDALWATPLEDDTVAAVTNVLPPDALDWPESLGMARGCDYFNSGVLLLNLNTMRANNLTSQLVAFGREQGETLKWPDQDAFNALLWRNRHVLHPRYNCQNSLYYWPQSRRLFASGAVAEATRNPAIVHFEGGHLAKPWHYLNRHPLRQRYLKHRAQTPWPDVKLEGKRPFFMLLRPLPTRWTIALLQIFYKLRARLR